MLDIRAAIISAFAAFIFGATSAWWITADYKEAKYQSAISKMSIDAADALQAATQKAINAEREHTRVAQELEVANHEFRKTLDQAMVDNRALADELGGLYDRNASAGDCAVPGNPAAAGGAVKPPAGSKLSKQLETLLLSESRRADEAAAYARTCYRWIQQIRAQPSN